MPGPSADHSASASADTRKVKQPEGGHLNDQPGKMATAAITGQHRDILLRAIFNVFFTEIAESAYAQIVDGLPLSGVERDSDGGGG